MSTNSCIAKPDGDGWCGRYVHWDGYPSGVGQQLQESYKRDFEGNLAEMTRVLVDDEPVGWSVLCGKHLNEPKSWVESGHPADDDFRPLSYTARGESPRSDDPTGDWITASEADDWLYIYVLTPGGVLVIQGGRQLGMIPWDDREAMIALDES